MIAADPIPVELRGYLGELTAAIGPVADLDAVYLLGSAALGAYQHGSSDVDVVTAGPLLRAERRALAETAEAVPCPARKLDLVVYPRGSHSWEINLETGEWVSKPVAAAWLRDRVRGEIEARR